MDMTTTVTGSHGHLTIAVPSGLVIDTYCGPDDHGYPEVACFDLREWHEAWPGERAEEMSAIDILDLGFWRVDGCYVEPCHAWREDARICIDMLDEE